MPETESETTITVEPAPESLVDYSPEGIDLSLVKWSLSLSPIERLRAAQDQASSLSRLISHARRV